MYWKNCHHFFAFLDQFLGFFCYNTIFKCSVGTWIMNLCSHKHMGYLPMSSGQKLMHNMVAITSKNNVTGNGLFHEIASYPTLWYTGRLLPSSWGELRYSNHGIFDTMKTCGGTNCVLLLLFQRVLSVLDFIPTNKGPHFSSEVVLSGFINTMDYQNLIFTAFPFSKNEKKNIFKAFQISFTKFVDSIFAQPVGWPGMFLSLPL